MSRQSGGTRGRTVMGEQAAHGGSFPQAAVGTSACCCFPVRAQRVSLQIYGVQVFHSLLRAQKEVEGPWERAGLQPPHPKEGPALCRH